jgi:ligand-binding sensor domain-containing protein/signal transduction histidine kinase/DNA-binding response OmpR family regulator
MYFYWMKRGILTFLIILTQLLGKGQDLVFNHLLTEDGLSQSSIFSITQDHRGLMWYGSRYGLNSYDGNQFRLYKSSLTDSTSLSADYITALYSDAKGVLWVGTINGLNKFNSRKNTFERVQLDSNRNKKAYYIRSIQEDRKGNLWIGCNYGLYKLADQKSNQWIRADRLGLPGTIAQSEVLSMLEDQEGTFWIGTNHSLVKSTFNGKFGSSTTFSRSESPTSISDNSITAIVEDQQHNLWIGTENGGINLLNKNTNQFTRFNHEAGNSNTLPHNAVRKMIISKSGELWIGTQEGLSILNPLTRKFVNYQHRKSNPNSLNQNSIYSIYQDANGSVWIGTYYGGVNVTYAAPTNFKTWQSNEKNTSLNYGVISSITEDRGGKLWIGSEGGGLNVYDPQKQTFTAFTYSGSDSSSLGSNLIKVVYADKSDQIWIGTHGGGLNLYNRSTGKFKRFFSRKGDLNATRSEIVTLLEDHTGKFWVGTQTGLGIYKRNGDQLEPYLPQGPLKLLADKNIKFLLEDADQKIWIAATTGLSLYNSTDNTLKLLRLPKTNLGSDYVNCLYQDSKKNIWIGLYYGGLLSYNTRTGKFTRAYTKKDGLANDNVLGILEDKQQQIWISTSNGLSKLDPQTGAFKTYTVSDGLSGNEFNYNSFFKSKKGTFFFGTYNGLTYFLPEEIQKNNFQAPILFTRLMLFNKPVGINGSDQLLREDISYTQKLVFKYDQNIFTLQFALLSYIKSRKNRYAYKLEGVNNQWIETAIPSATYTNLPPGSYTLLVKGKNNDGVWSKTASMEIEILPPFWKTWWAFAIYAILLGLIIFSITRFFYLRQLLAKDEELHQSKLNFFTNVSHEIRTHLTLIMVPIEKLLDDSKNTASTNTQLNKVKRNADRLLKLVSELMDFRKAETNHLKLYVAGYNLIAFIQDICGSFDALSAKKKIQFLVLYDQDPVQVYFDKVQLEKVFFNLVSNAFKFTPAGGSITVRICTEKDKVNVSVEDSGRGISPEYIDRLFTNFFQVDDHSIQNTGYGIGLALSKNIVELHHGIISLASTPATETEKGYTNFTVSLLLGTAHFSEINQPLSRPQPIISAQEPEKSIAPTEAVEAHQEKLHTVLIVEDHAELRSLIKESLLSNYYLIEAEDGLEGWEKATSEIPDLIISDVMMPQMDGYTFCNQLKSDPRTSHIPVILLTARNSETDQIMGLSGGADYYLTKPFSNKVLQLTVQNLFAARELMRQKFSNSFILEPQQITIDSTDEQFLSKLIVIIEQNMENENFGVETIIEEIGMSQSVLYKKLKALTNMSVNDFSKSIRLKRAAQLLKQRKHTVYEIGYMIGFTDRKYFSREFKKQFGKTPTEYIDL